MSSITLGSNITSLVAQRRLSENTDSLSRTFERLSSGQRINRASDDAAGLSVASSLQTGRRVYAQGVRNLNDGVSLLNIADGAIEQLSFIVIRLKELAEQGASGTYGVKQRRSLDAEAQALSKEYLRIARSTTFNGRGVFHGEFGELRLQSGYGIDGGVQSGLGGAIGTGTLGASASYALQSTRTKQAELADLNGDGFLDLVTIGDDPANDNMIIKLGLGDGSFGVSTTITPTGSSIPQLALADMNNDGNVDIVTMENLGASGAVGVRFGDGTGAFAAAVFSTETYAGYQTLALGDMNGDGVNDVVTSSYGSVRRRLGNGDGTFGSVQSTTIDFGAGINDQINDLALGDLDGDGDLDIFFGGREAAFPPFDGGTGVILNDGSGNMGAAAITVTSESMTGAAIGDVNGDGRMDLVSAGYSAGGGFVNIALGNGSGSFAAAVSQAFGTANSTRIKLGDLNGDGALDLVGAGGTVFSVSLGTGNGAFNPSVSYSADTISAVDVDLGDLNGDGVLDIVSAGDSGPGTSTIRLGQTRSGIGALISFRLTSRADALQALSQFDQALNRLSAQRGIIGSFQSRVAVATNVLQAAADNYGAAAGRITDVDVAAESSKLIRTQILQQAASSVLAQANQQPALAVRLLSP